MITASCAHGRTVIENCAAEPEVQDLAHFLNACGAKIMGAGTTRITIDGVEELHPTDFSIIPDRLQAGTYAIAAAITGGDVTVRNAVLDHSRPVFAKLTEMGVEVTGVEEGVRIRRVGAIQATDIKTLPPSRLSDRYAAAIRLAAVNRRWRVHHYGNRL